MSEKRWVLMLLVVAVVLGSGVLPAMAGTTGGEPGFAVVLPTGELMDDDELGDVDGGHPILVGIVAGVTAYVAGKLGDETWDNVVSPILEEKIWDPLREKGLIPEKSGVLCLP